MPRLIAALIMGSIIVTSIVTSDASAFTDIADDKSSLKNATPDQLRAKIKELALEISRLKAVQNQKAGQLGMLPAWLNPMSPGPRLTIGTPALALDPSVWPHYPMTQYGKQQIPGTPKTEAGVPSDLPKGTQTRQFNGMTVYMIPCKNSAAPAYGTCNSCAEASG